MPDQPKKIGIAHILSVMNNQQSSLIESSEKKYKIITVKDLQELREISHALERVELICKEMNILKHGKFHAFFVSKSAGDIIKKGGFNQRDIQLAEIAGYLHDLGYRLDIENHAFVSAGMAYERLLQLGMEQEEVDKVCVAIAYHNNLNPISPIEAAVAIAECSDFVMERTTKGQQNSILAELMNRCKDSKLVVDETYKVIRLELNIDFRNLTKEDFKREFEKRYICCKNSAGYLGFEYQVIINDEMIY